MRVLVTGGAGYIGSHACKELKKSGHEPITVDNLVYGHEWAVQWGPFHQINIHDTDRLQKIMKKEKVEAVMHFAAYAYVGESVQNPLKYYENNFSGTISLLTAMKKSGVRKFVFSSSCATYGMPKAQPITEQSEQNPINPYGQSKLMVERVLQDLARSGDIEPTALRYFNAAGADKDLDIGEDHDPETHVIPLAIEAALLPDRHLTIYGSDYPTPDGTCIRDYVHVTDLAQAHVKALEASPDKKSHWKAYNLGTGCGYSVQEIVDELGRILGREVKVRKGDRRPGDPPQLMADAKLAKKELGWEPQHSSLPQILESAARWYEKHHLKKRTGRS